MRISTAQMYDNGIFGLLQNQYEAYRLQNQLSLGRRIVTPADDPVAAARALVTEQKISVNQQFLDNQGNASAQLKELEALMGNLTNTLINLKSQWVAAGDGAYSDNELQAIAVDIRGKLAQVLGIANNADPNGFFRFAGYQASTTPFVSINGVISYQGDSGERVLQVETGRFMPVSFSGRELFEAIPNGNGIFVTDYGAGNTGSGVIDNGTLVGGVYDNNEYAIKFTDPNTFDIEMNGTVISTGNPYTPGEPINLGGAQVRITGAPNAGDEFTVSPSVEESMFATLDKFIMTLERGGNMTAEFKNDMQRIGASLESMLKNVVDCRAVVGARMAELDDLTNLGKDLDLQYTSQLSDLVDLDYYKAFSDLAKNQLHLEAARQSFSKVTGLSLFNYL